MLRSMGWENESEAFIGYVIPHEWLLECKCSSCGAAVGYKYQCSEEKCENSDTDDPEFYVLGIVSERLPVEGLTFIRGLFGEDPTVMVAVGGTETLTTPGRFLNEDKDSQVAVSDPVKADDKVEAALRAAGIEPVLTVVLSMRQE